MAEVWVAHSATGDWADHLHGIIALVYDALLTASRERMGKNEKTARFRADSAKSSRCEQCALLSAINGRIFYFRMLIRDRSSNRQVLSVLQTWAGSHASISAECSDFRTCKFGTKYSKCLLCASQSLVMRLSASRFCPCCLPLCVHICKQMRMAPPLTRRWFNVSWRTRVSVLNQVWW